MEKETPAEKDMFKEYQELCQKHLNMGVRISAAGFIIALAGAVASVSFVTVAGAIITGVGAGLVVGELITR